MKPVTVVLHGYTTAAKYLGVDPTTLYRRYKRNPDRWGPDFERVMYNGKHQPLWSTDRIEEILDYATTRKEPAS